MVYLWAVFLKVSFREHGSNDAKAETLVLWPPHAKSWLIGKDPDAGRDWGQEERGTTQDEMARWHHRLNGCEFEWTLGDGDGQEGLAHCDSWGHKESDMTKWLNWTELRPMIYLWLSVTGEMENGIALVASLRLWNDNQYTKGSREALIKGVYSTLFTATSPIFKHSSFSNGISNKYPRSFWKCSLRWNYALENVLGKEESIHISVFKDKSKCYILNILTCLKHVHYYIVKKRQAMLK